MANLEGIQAKINNENIVILDCNVPLENKAISIDLVHKQGIYINRPRIESKDDEFNVLVHEYGHLVSGATHKLTSPYQLICQHERRANRAAVHEFLPFEKLQDAFEYGCTETWELAEYLDMPEKFVLLAIDIYTCEGYIEN